MQLITKSPETTATTLADAKYLALTTFRKDGTPKLVPVWPVDAGEGRVGLITSSKTWKVRRIANDARVELQPSDSRGRVTDDTEPISGTAQVVDGADFHAMRVRVGAKYGFQLKLISFFHSLPGRRTGHPNDRAIIVTLDG
jgi:PPOX class probable F420-dependent enzyme